MTMIVQPGDPMPSGISAKDLRQNLLTKRVHLAEINRRIFGADTDLDIIAGAISSANRGYMVDITDLESESMLYDPHLSSLAVKRLGALGAADTEITPPPGVAPSDRAWAAKIADMCNDVARRVGIFQAIYDTAWALFFGRAASEVHWASGAWGYQFAPYSIDWVHPRRLCYGAFRELRVVDTNHQTMTFTSQHGVPVEDVPGKFLYWKPRLFSEYAEREGLGPRSMYWTFFKRFAMRHRMKLTEIFGIPWRIVTIDKDSPANPESIAQARLDAEDLGGETTAVFDKGIGLDVEWPGENSGDLFKMTHEDVNTELSKLWVGNTATADQQSGSGSGNRANSIVGKGEQDIIFQLDGNGLQHRVQQVLNVLVLQNYGPGAMHLCSQFKIRTQPPRDRDKEITRVQTTLGMGLPIAEADVREIAGYRAPLPDEVYMVGKSTGVDASGKPLPPQIIIVDPAKTAPEQEPKAAPNSAPPNKSEPSPGQPGGAPVKKPPVPPTKGASTADEPHEVPNADPKTGPEERGVDGAAAAAIKDALGMMRRIFNGDASAVGPLHRLIELEFPKYDPPDDPRAPEMPDAFANDMPRNLQPATAVNGSPETLIERGTNEGARETTKWAAHFSNAASGESALEIRGRLTKAANALDVEKFARAVEKRLVWGLMLGALDADWEAENDKVIRPPAFDIGLEREGEALELADIGPGGGVVDFVAKPFAEAVREFNSRKVVTRRAFDRMMADAKQRAFTVAGLAKKSMLDTAHAELARALEEGDDLRRFAAALNQRFDDAGWTRLNASHVETVFRNNTMGAYAQGRDAQMSQPHVLAARPYWQVMGVKDDRTRANHRAALGKVLAASDSFWGKAPLPWGHNCFFPATKIQARAIGASRALYAGEFVQLTTAKGRRLTVTANHPVLTAQGFAAAKTIREGRELLCYGSEVDSSRRGGSHNDEHQKEARIEDVFAALGDGAQMTTAPTRGEDFHGEAHRFIGEIEVVGTYRDLMVEMQPVQSAGALQVEFMLADLAGSRQCTAASGRDGIGAPAARRMRGGHLARTGMLGQPGPFDALRFGSASELDAELSETIDEVGARDAQLIRELLHGGPGLVALDRVVRVEKFNARGHVYDLETTGGWLVADGIISSNCRCRKVSRSQADVERLGLEVVSGASLGGLPDKGWNSSTP